MPHPYPLLLAALFVACAPSSSAPPDAGSGTRPRIDAATSTVDGGPLADAACTACATSCTDGVDDDGDGWVDALDPDCANGDERGLGTSPCNDGVDNDGDGVSDALDPECVSGASDEVLGDAACADACLLGDVRAGRTCERWDAAAQAWTTTEPGSDRMHDQARVYSQWLRNRLMPVGGVMRGHFTDGSYTTPVAYGGTRDSPIWTGIYLAAEALRYAQTRAPDALAQMDATIRTMDRWWRISGDAGYLARYAVPVSSPGPVLAIFSAQDPENHRNVSFEGDTWHWKGNVSRDQYQGAFFGFATAYDVLDDAALKQIIRSRIVATVEQLMKKETRSMKLTVDGLPMTVDMELQHVIYTDDETEGGGPEMDVSTSPFDAADKGFVTFWPNPAEHLRQVPLLSWLPDVYLRSQAVQLGGMFAVALHVTKDVPEYAARRAAIKAHYDAFYPRWLDMAKGWENNNNCGSSYHGLNIAFLPAHSWARLEDNPQRRQEVRDLVLRDRMWAAVHDHKNVFFALIYASQGASDEASVAAAHVAQLRQFPAPPNVSVAVDNRAGYPADPDCEGQSKVAIDVRDRIPTSFLWERNPWKLVGELEPNKLYPGVDYLITYWMARHYGYLGEDAPDTCLQWRRGAAD